MFEKIKIIGTEIANAFRTARAQLNIEKAQQDNELYRNLDQKVQDIEDSMPDPNDAASVSRWEALKNRQKNTTT